MDKQANNKIDFDTFSKAYALMVFTLVARKRVNEKELAMVLTIFQSAKNMIDRGQYSENAYKGLIEGTRCGNMIKNGMFGEKVIERPNNAALDEFIDKLSKIIEELS